MVIVFTYFLNKEPMLMISNCIGDARGAIQVLRQSIEYCITKETAKNPNFWKGTSLPTLYMLISF